MNAVGTLVHGTQSIVVAEVAMALSSSIFSATSSPTFSFAEDTVESWATEGPGVGAPDTGEVLGLRVGASDTGEEVGASDTGEEVGASDTGEEVGASDTGEEVGASDTGEVLGLRVGASETGEALGLRVGATLLGKAVGAIVGVPDGDATGAFSMEF